MRLPDGAIYAPRLRGRGDDVLHRQYHVRRISRETVRSAPAAQTSRVGRSSRKKNRPRVLRLLGPRQSKTVVLNCSGGRCSGGLLIEAQSAATVASLQLCTDSPSLPANTIPSSWIGSLPVHGARLKIRSK